MTLALLLFAAAASAAVKTKEVEYMQGETPMKGFLAWDDAAPGRRPGVIVVHEWWGLNDYARKRAEMLAKAGYVAFALDMFGNGKVTTHPQDAQGFVAEAMKDPAVIGARFNAGLDQLKADEHVNGDKIGAIGYCFGGAVVLGMARMGADLDAVASFHGALATQHPAEKGAVKAKVLVMTGTADEFVPADQVKALEDEMKAAGAGYQVIRYPGAKHGFTNPDAGSYGMKQLEYNASADKKSWAAMLKLFKTALK
jgi:dienelactone hydrolase